MNAQPTRNLFFSYDHDDQMRPIAPCRTIPITDEIQREDAAKQAARKVVITWKPRLSDPTRKTKPKAHAPSKDPRKPSAPKRHRPCKHCAAGTISRCNKKEICADCRKKAIADRYAEYVNARKRKSAPEPSKPKRQYVSSKRNPTPTREQLREQWRRTQRGGSGSAGRLAFARTVLERSTPNGRGAVSASPSTGETTNAATRSGRRRR